MAAFKGWEGGGGGGGQEEALFPPSPLPLEDLLLSFFERL